MMDEDTYCFVSYKRKEPHYFDPLLGESVANAIIHLMNNKELYGSLQRKELEKVKAFPTFKERAEIIYKRLGELVAGKRI